MKIALIHELLTVKGGAERLLRVLVDLFPDAPIYTLLYNERKMSDWFPADRIRTSSVQWMTRMVGTNHHPYLPLFPQSVENWDFSEFDLVLSVSSAFAHGIVTQGKTRHIAYINSPARYLWDRSQEILASSSWIKRRYGERMFHRLRMWDVQAAERGDLLLAASKTVQRRIELYWRRESSVVYPPVDIDVFPLHQGNRDDYYVLASQLAPYKRIEFAIDACNRLQKKLIIAGEGPHRKHLESMAGPTIEFVGFCERSKLVELYQHARAFLFPGDEDFGIAPMEAMATGTPVIAYRSGGALETVLDGETGSFFHEATGESLAEAIRASDRKTFDPAACRRQAETFSREKFENGIRAAISGVGHDVLIPNNRIMIPD